MLAVILDRNKQYLVEDASVFKVDYINAKVDDVLCFNKILFFDLNGSVFVGSPFVCGKVVLAKVLKHFKEDKKLILKFKRRKNYVKRFGHRQKYTLLKIIGFENK